MTKVNTVLGPVPVEELGWTLMHEHIYIALLGWEFDPRNSFDWQQALESIAGEMGKLRDNGVRTVVDATTIDMGRNVEFLFDVAKRSGVNIVASTGLFTEGTGLPFYFRGREVDDIADWMVRELTEGMGRTSVRAGAIKVGTGLGRIGQYEEKVLRAACRAQRRTGAPIITHTEGGTMGREQVDIFEAEGADLSRVVIGHSCSNGDLRYHFDILRRGANLGVDKVGHNAYMPEDVRLAIITGAVAAGYAGQVMLSQDMIGSLDGRILPLSPMRVFDYIVTGFLPKLRDAGVSQRSIEAMLAGLPRKMFGG